MCPLQLNFSLKPKNTADQGPKRKILEQKANKASDNR